MRSTQPTTVHPTERRPISDSRNSTVQSNIQTPIGNLQINEDAWRESQVEEPERWDGMS